MPLFGFVRAYDLVRPNSFQTGVHIRTMKRLAMIGVVATIPFVALGGLTWGIYQLNILFLLFSLTVITYFIEKGSIGNFSIAVLIFLVGGALVEF